MVGQDSRGKGKVADGHDERDMISIDDETKGEKPVDSGSNKKKDGKKKKHTKKIVYYERRHIYIFDGFAKGRLFFFQ
jgi:hypothetical protein